MESKNIMSEKQGSTRFGWRFSDVPALVPIKKRRIQIIEVSRSPSPPPKQLSPVLENSPPSKYVLDSPSSKNTPDLLPSNKFTHGAIDIKLLSNSHCSNPVSLSPSAPSSKDTSIQSPKSAPFTSEEDSNRNYSSLEEYEKTVLCSPRSGVKLRSILSSGPNSLTSGKCLFPEGEVLTGSSAKTQFQSIKISKQNPLPSEVPPEDILCSMNSELQLENLPSPNPSTSPNGNVVIASSPKPKSPLTNISSPNALSPRTEISSKSTLSIHRSSSCLTIHDELPTNADKTKLHRSEGSLIHADETRCDNNSQEVEDGELVISRESNMGDLKVIDISPEVTSGAPSMDILLVKPNFNGFRDDRSCWDLNREMDCWDKMTNTTKDKSSANICLIAEDKLIKSPGKISNVGFEQELKDNDCAKDGIGVVGITTNLVVCNEHGISENTGIDASNGIFGDDSASSMGLKELPKTFGEAEMNYFSETKDFRMGTHEKHMLKGHRCSSKRRDGNMNELPEDLEVEEQMDYSSVSVSDDAAADDKTGIDLGNREAIQYERYQETGSLMSWGSKTISDSSDGQRKHDENLESQKSCTTGRIRSTGWDQLPVGFDNAEEALKAARETLVARRGGRGGRISTIRPQGVSGHRFTPGRDLSRDGSALARSENYRDRHFEDRRESFIPKRMNDNDEDYNWGGRVSGREVAGRSSRGRGPNECGDAQGKSTGQWGQGRSGFSSHRPTHTTSSGSDNGFVTRDSVNARGGGRGSVISTFRSSRGAGGHRHIGDGDSGSNLANRLDREMSNSGVEPRGRGHMDRYGRSYGEGFEFNRSVSPHKLHSSGNRTGSRGLRHESKSFSVRNQWSSPPPKWPNDRREGDCGFREREFKGRSHGPSGRTSPHVVHGSSLMDERDWQVLAGTRTSPTAREGFNNSKEGFNPSREGFKSPREELNSSLYSGGNGLEGIRRIKFIENEGFIDSKDDYERNSRDDDKYRDAIRGHACQRERENEGIRRRRDSRRLSSRDRSTSLQRHASSLEGDDEMAPRRRRPS